MIELDRERGVNPHLTYCPRCGGESNEIMLIGARRSIRKCECGARIIGHRNVDECPKCGVRHRSTLIGKVEDGERLPATRPCDACRKELEVFAAVVRDGGVYWKCPKGHSGVLRPEAELSKHVREASGIAAPDPVGVELDGGYCPACAGRKE